MWSTFTRKYTINIRITLPRKVFHVIKPISLDESTRQKYITIQLKALYPSSYQMSVKIDTQICCPLTWKNVYTWRRWQPITTQNFTLRQFLTKQRVEYKETSTKMYATQNISFALGNTDVSIRCSVLHLVSPLVFRGLWMSIVVLYCWCHSDSASVLLYFTFKGLNSFTIEGKYILF